MAKKPADGKGADLKVVARNRKAFHEYEITDRIECGVVLVGTEVKSLRAGHAVLDGSYAKLDDGELWLINSEIPEYEKGNQLNHKPKRSRKLLLHRREIEKFAGKATQKGFTLVPLQIYFKEGRAKVEIGVARGKQLHDKRASAKKAEAQKEIRRVTSARGRGRE
jgi:SsrA-binding protein